MIRHKNGKNKPLYIGGKKYDGSKTVVVELAPDKSEYKNFFLTYIAGYDEYKLVFCPLNLEEITPLETHIYSDEDCTVEIALITEIVEGTNDVKVLYPDGKQAIFLFSNTKETNGLVDFETMKDYVADYVEEHGAGGGGGAIEQPLNLKQSPVSEFVSYNGSTPVYFETKTAYTKIFENVRENEDTTKENYSKPLVLFSFSKQDLKDENENISFILKFCETDYGDGDNQYELKLQINFKDLSYTSDFKKAENDILYYPVQKFISVYRYDFRYYVAIKKIGSGFNQRLFSLYGSINVRLEKNYLDNNINIDPLINETDTQVTASGDILHQIYKLSGAEWIDADQIDKFVETLELNKKRYYTFYYDIAMMKDLGGAWFHNKMLIPNMINLSNFLCSIYLLGDNNIRNDYGKNFGGLTNYYQIHQMQSWLPQDMNNFFSGSRQLTTVNLGEEIRAKSIDGAFYNCTSLIEIIGIINLTYLEQLPTEFLCFNVKYVEIKGLPANTVFTETLFKTWNEISWESTVYMLTNANKGNENINLHVTQYQYNRLLTEAINDSKENIEDENDFVNVLKTKYFTNIIIDANN